jgi:hypothetical protein
VLKSDWFDFSAASEYAESLSEVFSENKSLTKEELRLLELEIELFLDHLRVKQPLVDSTVHKK